MCASFFPSFLPLPTSPPLSLSLSLSLHTPWNETKAAWGGREKEDCLLSLWSRLRRQRCLRPLNPPLERERTNERTTGGKNGGGRELRKEEGRDEGGRLRSSILSFFRLRSIGRSVDLCAAPADWSNLYSRTVKLSLFFMALLPLSLPLSLSPSLSIRTNEGRRPHLSTLSTPCSRRQAG